MKNVNEQSLDLFRMVAPIPTPPPMPSKTGCNQTKIVTDQSCRSGCSLVSTAARDSWDRLFDEGYRSDVLIYTDNGGIIYAHSNIIEMASEVIHGILKQSKRRSRWRSISIRGVPLDAARAFFWFLYSSRYEKEDMEEFAMHMLVLSHVYVVPQLKKLCEWHLEHGLLTKENVVDVLQLALLCDAPRLSLISHRMILSNFTEISASEGWKSMTQSHPMLEKELSAYMRVEQKRLNKRAKKRNEKEMYSQLYEAMEALVHICREWCKTKGPHDKHFKSNQDSCSYSCRIPNPSLCQLQTKSYRRLRFLQEDVAASGVAFPPLCRFRSMPCSFVPEIQGEDEETEQEK